MRSICQPIYLSIHLSINQPASLFLSFSLSPNLILRPLRLCQFQSSNILKATRAIAQGNRRWKWRRFSIDHGLIRARIPVSARECEREGDAARPFERQLRNKRQMTYNCNLRWNFLRTPPPCFYPPGFSVVLEQNRIRLQSGSLTPSPRRLFLFILLRARPKYESLLHDND